MSHPSDPTPTELSETGPAAWHSSPTARQAWFSVPVLLCAVLALWLVLLAFCAYQNTAAMQDAIHWQAKTQQQIRSLYQIKSAWAEAESAVGGFLLTGEAKYLQAHERAVKQMAAEWPALQRVDAQTPWSPQALQIVAIAIQARLARLGQAIATRQTQGFTDNPPGLLDNGGGEGKAPIQAQIEQLQDEAMNFMADRLTEGDNKTNAVTHTVGLGFLLSTALLALIFFTLRREIAERVKAVSELAEHRDHLEIMFATRSAELAQAIDEHRAVNLALLENEERLRLVLQASAMGTFEFDLDCGQSLWNSVEFDLLGLQPGAVPASPETLFNYVHPDDRAQFVTKWQEALQTGQLDAEFRIVRADGELRWLAGRGRFASDAAGGEFARRRFLGVNFDITERKRAEQRLRHSEAALAKAQTIAHLGSWERDLETGESRWSDQMYRLFGEEPQAFPASYEQFLAHVHPDDRQRVNAVVQNATTKGEPFSFEYRVPTPQGGLRTILAQAEVELSAGGGRPRRVFGIVQDISEGKEAEAAKARLAALVESSQDAIIGKDLNGLVNSWNLGAEALFGYTAAEMLGRSIKVLVPACRCQEEDEILARLVKGESVAHYETEGLRKDGSLLFVSLTVSPIWDACGNIVGASKIARNITERRRTEEERDRYITLVKNSADFIGMCDLKGVPFFVNDAGLNMLGLDGPEDLAKIAVGDCFFPEDQPFIMEKFLPSTLLGSAEIEIRFRHFKTGAAIWMIYSVFALRDADGRPTGFATVSRNITERKRMEQALLASEQFKQGILDSLPAHVAVLDDEGTILAVNRPWLRFAEQNGSPESARLAVGTNYLEVCRNAVRNGEPVAETVLQGLEAVLSGAKPLFELEYPCDLPNEKRWYVVHILKPAADIGGAIVTHLDISERKLAEEALRETQRQNAFLADILENSSQPFGLGYPGGHRGMTNQAFQALLGFSAGELAGMDWAATLTPHEWREIEAEKIAELDRIDGPVRYEKEYWRKDGSRVPVELLVNEVKDEAGKPEYYYAFVTDISERKRGEDALRQERLFLRQVIDAVPSLIFVKDQEGRILLCNEAFARDYGCCVDDLVGKANGEFNLHADEVAQFYHDDREVIATGQPKIIGEEKATHADGTVHWYSTAKLPMSNADGVCDRVLGVATDITARKQAEEALRHSQADLNRAQAVAHTGSWRLDVLKNRLTWSDENHRMFDINKDAPLNYEAFLATVHPDDRDYVDAAWRAALAGKPYDIEHRIIVGERIKWVRERAELEFDETGTLLGGFGTTQDISELKSSQKALQQERSFLRQVLDATPSIIFVKDREGRFILGNEALAQGYGSTTAALLGMRDADFNPNAEEVAQFLRNDREVLDSGKPKLFPLERVTLVDGTAHWFSTMKVPLPEADGSCVKLLGVATDITERKRAEEALQEADRRKDEFLAMLAHELRNPLTPIMVAAQMLQNRGTPDPALMKWAGDTVKHQCENLTQLVNQLLDVSRVTKGKVTLQKKPLDLRDLLRRAVESCKPNIAQHRHELTLADMPEPVPVKADAVRIEQVIGNLLNNAAKYTPDGGSIRVSLVREDAAAVIRVRDNGIGISAAMLPSVFDLFVQAERTLDRAQGGLGIGLALVKSLIELHGGSTSAKSAGIGAGSEFEVRLPLMVEAMEPCAVPKATAQTPAKSRRVLVVDDNEDVRVSMAMLLRAMGHQVWEAEGGQEALALPGLADLDAVLMDIGMPGLNGYEVARLLRQDPAFDAVILIAMTGYSQEYDRQESLRAGFKHHLVKPFDPAVFADILAEID